jgi:hypothetical protein
MKIYDTIFLKVRQKYIEWNEKDMPGLYAVGVVSVLQIVNVLSVWLFLADIKTVDFPSRVITISISALFIIHNSIRYFSVINYNKIQKRYGDHLNDKRSNRIILIYVSISIMAITSLLIYRIILVNVLHKSGI